MKNYILPILLLLLTVPFLMGVGGKMSSYTINHTFTIDTTSNSSSADTIRFVNAYGTFNVSMTPDSTGADEGATDTLAFQYRMLVYDNGTWRLLHTNWLSAEIDNAGTWVTSLNWTDGTTYRVDLSDLDVCDGIEAKIVLGTGDSLLVSIPTYFEYQKQE